MTTRGLFSRMYDTKKCLTKVAPALAAAVSVLIIQSLAQAQCASPSAPAGSYKFDSASKRQRYCNGTMWVEFPCNLIYPQKSVALSTPQGTLSSWVVPTEFDGSNNTIGVFGAGGSYQTLTPASAETGGGGGGGYSEVSNYPLTPGSTVFFHVGTSNIAGPGDSWFGGTSYSTSIVAAAAGAWTSSGSGGIGGPGTLGIGTIRYSGGDGGMKISISCIGGGGGGGAAGPNGDGARGGHCVGTTGYGAGGGGANGGSIGGAPQTGDFGDGGFNRIGTSGSLGAGGNGATQSSTGGTGSPGANGTKDPVWTEYASGLTFGPGGGGGGSGRNNGTGPPGFGGRSLGFGGGSGGRGDSINNSTRTGTGGSGGIIVTYVSTILECEISGYCTREGLLRFNAPTAKYEFCNGTHWIPVIGTTATACSRAGELDFDFGNSQAMYCNGTTWISF